MKIATTVMGMAAAVALAAGSAVPAGAAVKSIRAASCFPKGTTFSKRFEAYLADLSKHAKGWKVRYVGGAPAIGSPFTLVDKMAKGAFDMVSCTGAYYQNVLPEADALKMWEKGPAAIRKNGGWAFMDKLHQAKNIKLIARLHSGEHFHLYLRKGKPISKPDLHGLNLRVSPIYRNFFQALGATTQRSNIAQIYTYMDNKTVDGFGWPITGLLPDWLKVTGYRVDPGFYDADIQLLMNLDTWKKMSKAQKALVLRLGLKWERIGVRQAAAQTKAARAAQKKAGIKTITFTGAARKKWLAAARNAGWAGIIKVSPVNGPKLRKYFAAK